MKLKVLLVLCMVFAANAFSQAQMENYKFIIVPTKFEFQNTSDQYRVNTLIRKLFKDKGYDVYFENQTFPDELAKNNCKALYANMETWGTFDTKTVISLLDCKGKLVFTSEEGRSKTKDYKEAYHETVRLAFESIQDFRFVPPADNAIYYEFDTQEDEVAVFNTDSIEIDQYYNFNDDIFVMLPTDNGFNIIKKDFKALKKEDQSVKVGTLIASSRANSYLLKMDQLQAAAYFDADGNLVFDQIDQAGAIQTQKFIKVK